MLGRKMSQKSPNCQGLVQCRSGPGNNMVSELNHHSSVPCFKNHLPQPRQFLRNRVLLKKITWGNAHWTSYWIWIEGPPGHCRSQGLGGPGIPPQSKCYQWQKCGKKAIVSSVSVSFSIFHVQRFLLAFVNNIAERGPQAPSIHILPTNLDVQLGRNWEFFSKICHLRPSSILFMVVMQ